ncbi:MAG: multicopper oxidase domain-containing protein [Rudaea sp.]|nr:multicopper oxidase domain-containing protein [Rudaea sp.]
MTMTISRPRPILLSAIKRCIVACSVGFALSTAMAADAPDASDARELHNPPVLLRSDLRLAATALPRGEAPREVALDLDIAYTDNKLFNPASGLWDKVHLRSYTGRGVDPNAPFVAPTIEVTPGETVRISLHNKLLADPDCTNGHLPVNTPHCFNGTNLHSHGLWVSPTGNSDNVLLSINPGVSFQYEYNIPADHPSGTFWYHTHRHGSTALHVSSGMGGALIVRGDRKPDVGHQGDLDTLLRTPSGDPFAERILVMQQIQYACVGADGKLKYKDGKIDWTCNPGETGVIESYDQLSSTSWSDSGHYTSINGVVLPTFTARSGTLERWRLIHAGVRDTISFQLRRMSGNLKSLAQLKVKPEDQQKFADQVCSGPVVPQFVVASDGLTMKHAQKRNLTTLQPAYRDDLLVAFPEPGRYCVVNASAPASGSVTQAATGRQVIGFVDVAPGDKVPDIERFIVDTLVKSAQANMPASVQSQIVADLRNKLSLSKFVPHPDITDDEVKGNMQHLVFYIDTSKPKTTFEIGTDQSDLEPYDPKRIDRVLKLGDAQTWQLESHRAGHPFHIHVNPFQIEKIIDPNGKDVSLPDAVDNPDGKGVDPQYAGLKGVWKDTLWAKGPLPGTTPPKGVYRVYIRTRYERYIGDFVLHCHILDHEDQGMMQNVSIRLPDGAGGVSTGHH